MFSLFDDPLQDASKAEIQALLRDVSHLGKGSVQLPEQMPEKLRPSIDIPVKPRTRKMKVMPLESLPGVGLNQSIVVNVKLPAYLIAGLRAEGDLDELLHEAARDLLEKRGKTWWHPRFRSAMLARVIEQLT